MAIDTDALRKIDIAAVIQQDLGPAVAQRGQHLMWRCPFHTDSTPSLDVNRQLNKAFCNPCGLGLDTIGWVMLYRKIGFVSACAQLSGVHLPEATVAEQAPAPAEAPEADWQQRAFKVMTYGMNHLSASPAAQQWLRNRKLNELSMQSWRLGYNPRGQMINGLWVDAGILIPDICSGEVWGIKVRLLPGHAFRCSGCGNEMTDPGRCPKCGKPNKYRGVKGNRANLYGRYVERRVVFLCEGEFDAQLVWQEGADLGGVATTTGGAGKKWLPEWTRSLLDAERLVVLFDADAAGERGAAALEALGRRVYVAHVPAGKDVTEHAQAEGGVELFRWLARVRRAALDELYPTLQAQREHLQAALVRRSPPALYADYFADLAELNER